MTDYSEMVDGDPLAVFYDRHDRTIIITDIDFTRQKFVMDVFDAQGNPQKVRGMPIMDFLDQFEHDDTLVRVQ